MVPVLAWVKRGGIGPLIAACFLVTAIFFGGGGSPTPVTEMIVQLCFVTAALCWLWLREWSAGAEGRMDPLAWLVIGMILAIPLLQLVPLPPALWANLPGRDGQTAALDLVGAAGAWRPISLSPAQTVASLLAIIPALFAFFITASLDLAGRRWILAAIAGMALASALLGAVQIAAGSAAPRLYEFSHSGWITGFHANRNAAADLLLIGALALAALLLPAPGHTRANDGHRRSIGALHWMAIGIAVLLVATILTGSRAGIALIPLTLLAIAVMLWPRLKRFAHPRLLWVLYAGGIGIVAACLVLLRENTAIGRVAARFAVGGADRFALWEDSLFALAQYWPAGFGLGGFTSAILPAERLEAVDPTIPNRAHNDYIEFILEAGILGLAVLIAITALAIFAAIRAWRRGPEARVQAIMGLSTLLLIALHSLVDYSLRSMALACVAGAAGGLLASPRSGKNVRGKRL